MYNKEKYKKGIFRLDRPNFKDEFVWDAQTQVLSTFPFILHRQIEKCEAHCVVLDMIASAFHKAIEPWDEVLNGDLLTLFIGVCPMDNWPYLLLKNTGHQINWVDDQSGFVLIEPDVLKSRRYFKSI